MCPSAQVILLISTPLGQRPSTQKHNLYLTSSEWGLLILEKQAMEISQKNAAFTRHPCQRWKFPWAKMVLSSVPNPSPSWMVGSRKMSPHPNPENVWVGPYLETGSVQVGPRENKLLLFKPPCLWSFVGRPRTLTHRVYMLKDSTTLQRNRNIGEKHEELNDEVEKQTPMGSGGRLTGSS